jgi:hypothetical protein
MSRNRGALTLLDPSGPAWPVMGVLYLFNIFIYLFTGSFQHLSIQHTDFTITLMEITEGFSNYEKKLQNTRCQTIVSKRYCYCTRPFCVTQRHKGAFPYGPKNNLNFLKTPNRSHAGSCTARLCLQPLAMPPAQFILPVRTFHAGNWHWHAVD